MQIEELVPLLDPSAVPRVLTWSTALRLGWTPEEIRHRVITGRWERVLPRVYFTGRAFTWRDRLDAAVLYAGAGALLSGAAALCDLGLASVRTPATVLVIVPAHRQPRSTDWVRVRTSCRPCARSLQAGPPRVGEARAVADLALGCRRLNDVRALVTETVRMRHCTLDELAFELRHGPQRGSAHLRQAVEEARGGAWSAPEAEAATLLRQARVPQFEQNVPVTLADGRSFTVDFLWRALRAVLEIDSDTHHALTGDAEWTSDRHALLETADYTVLHRTPRFIREHPGRFTDGIAAWLASRADVLAARALPS